MPDCGVHVLAEGSHYENRQTGGSKQQENSELTADS